MRRKSRNHSYFPAKRNISLRNQIFLANQNRGNRFVRFVEIRFMLIRDKNGNIEKISFLVSGNVIYIIIIILQMHQPVSL